MGMRCGSAPLDSLGTGTLVDVCNFSRRDARCSRRWRRLDGVESAVSVVNYFI